MSEFAKHTERLSDVDGYTIVRRTDHSPRIHLLRPYPECNVPATALKLKGSREHVLFDLGRLGHKTAVSCRRCFPYSAEDDVEDTAVEDEA